MAYNNHSSIVLLLALLFFTAANPFVHGNIVSPLKVTGRLCCTSSGNCPGGRGVNGVTVLLSCNVGGTAVNVANATTNVIGSFIITASPLSGIQWGQRAFPCVAIVPLPLNSAICSVLSTTNGTLVSPIRSIGTPSVQVGIAVGFVKVAA